MPNYYLMNKDDKLLEFCTEPGLGGTRIKELRSFDKRRPIGFTNIAKWIEQRNYAKHKEHFSKWLKEWGLDTTDGFLEISHCLSINDCLWVKRSDSPLTWDKVNLYQNEFSDVASKTAFETGLYGMKLSSTSPEFTAEGTFPKCWIKSQNNIVLYKSGLTGASNVGLEPYSEYMASHISKKISQHNVVEYNLQKYKGKICSVCELFTNENVGFVPVYKVTKTDNITNLGDVLDLCTDLGFEQECREMILIDSIVFNQDRHLGNFGFLFDTDTFEITGFAPLFDFNLSMLCNALEEDLKNFDKYEEEYRVGHKLGGRFSEVGQQVLTPSIKSSLPNQIRLPMHELYNLPVERMDLLSDIVQENYEKILGKERFYNIPSLKEQQNIER